MKEKPETVSDILAEKEAEIARLAAFLTGNSRRIILERDENVVNK